MDGGPWQKLWSGLPSINIVASVAEVLGVQYTRCLRERSYVCGTLDARRPQLRLERLESDVSLTTVERTRSSCI
jgi:hypothetical protein